MMNPGVVLSPPWPEPSIHDSELSNNLDRGCERVLVIRMPDNAQYLPQKIREL